MERCSRDWGRPVAEKARIRLKVGNRLARVDVEDLNAVLLRSTTHISMKVTSSVRLTYVANTGACSWTLSVRR